MKPCGVSHEAVLSFTHRFRMKGGDKTKPDPGPDKGSTGARCQTDLRKANLTGTL